jgi:type IV secretory pathway VirB6-like protein
MMDVLTVISQGCSNITATSSPGITNIGVLLTQSLGTSLIVYEAVMESISSATGRGFDVAKFARTVFIVMVTLAFVEYYDSTIPGMNYSLKTVISQGTVSLVQVIGNSSSQTMMNDITNVLSNEQAPGLLSSAMKPVQMIVYVIIVLLLSLLEAVMVCVIAYGAVAAAIMGLLGPLFIPFLLFSKTEWLFWGWLRAYLGFSFYQVVSAAVFAVMGQLFVQYFTSSKLVTAIGDPAQMIAFFPLLLILIITNIYIMFKVPDMTASLFSGSTGGHDSVIGMAAGMAARAAMAA